MSGLSVIARNVRRTVVVKAADETVNNSTTLQDDDDLQFEMTAGATYRVRLIVLMTASPTSGFKFRVTGGSGVMNWFYRYANFSSPGIWETLGVDDVKSVSVSSVRQEFWLDGVVHSAAAGTLKLQWAQGSAEVFDTKVLQNSTLVVEELLS